MCQTNLESAQLCRANFTSRGYGDWQTDLTQANLANADLSYADFTGATLTKANLTGADITGTIFTDANLEGAIMPDGSIYS